ncbi:alpha/beta fold hydrolase [Terrabacter terrae]|uniref:Alpha/beta fold hydrolase n=1 Tax=Terrabacter terrae TaxID=318434 RepID=A0ABN2ULA2_9MICO
MSTSLPGSALTEHWTLIDGVKVFYRASAGPPGAATMMHVHGFGLSGRYLLPTAERLSGQFRTLVPDLPGFGRSGRPREALDVPELGAAVAAFLDDRGVESVTLVGNSMGCAVICEFAHLFPDRLERAVLVSPAGGLHNQPLRRAVQQLAQDGIREPLGLIRVAVPDYVRFGVPSTMRTFRALTRYPALDRLLALHIPTLVVLGSEDPLMPAPPRVKEVASRFETRVVLVVIDGAAHAVNFSHPGELANVTRRFMADLPIEDDPEAPGKARAYEIYRGADLPPLRT